MVNHAGQGHISVAVRSGTDVQIVRYIPFSSRFPSECLLGERLKTIILHVALNCFINCFPLGEVL